MIQFHIPAEYADAVREAMTCKTCDGGWLYGPVAARPCPDCPPSFWWGVKGDTDPLNPALGSRADHAVLSAEVQAMLDPCPKASNEWLCHEGCDSCGATGRPLVELVTPAIAGPGTYGPVTSGTLSLGFVTADEVLPIELNAASERTRDHVAISYVYDPQGEAFIWRTDRTVTDITLIGPSDATHAILLTLKT